MAATLDVTIAGVAANSYVDLSEASVFFDERLTVTAWENATTDQKIRALIQATRRIDMEMYQGDKATTGQALEWPRWGVEDRDGYWYSEGVIPQPVKDAQCEMAIALLAGESDPFGNTGLEGFKEAQIGPLRVVVAEGRPATQLPDIVARLLAPLIGARSGNGRVLRA